MMSFLQAERETLSRCLPGLDEELQKIPFEVLEAPGSPGLQHFRACGGAALLIPKEHGGAGASALDIVQIHRALASRSPSLAVATNMHTCTILSIPLCVETEGLFKLIASKQLYLASAFAEGRTNCSVLEPAISADPVEGGWLLSGCKKPCSLSESMDFLTASVLLPARNGPGLELALATIPAGTPGMEVRPLRAPLFLGGSETNEIVLTRVAVPVQAITYFGSGDELNSTILRAFLWFELFVSACYLGIASAMIEHVILMRRGSATERVALAVDAEGAMAALEGVAHAVNLGKRDPGTIAKSLFVRYAVQKAIERISALAAELSGGIQYLTSPKIAQLFAASRALAFHPPSRTSASASLDTYLAGSPLEIS